MTAIERAIAAMLGSLTKDSKQVVKRVKRKFEQLESIAEVLENEFKEASEEGREDESE